jgi:uncharacterized membrane protein YcaP (DUF421 family)
MELIYYLFGSGKDLNSLQMGLRALVMFFITLMLIRIAGMRAFGTKSAFDNVLVIMLGAVLSRAVVGASPFIPVIVASMVLVLIYRILAYLGLNNDKISHLLKTRERSLYKNGKINEENMKRCNISMGDLLSGIRSAGCTDRLEDLREVLMERSGEISVIKK